MSEGRHADPQKKGLEIGNEMIDAQYRMLVLLLRKLDITVKGTLPHKAVMGITLEIRKSIEFHFLSEENLVSELQYPETAAHERIHSELLSQLNIFIAKINRHQEFPEDILGMIHDWIAHHVA